MAILIQKIIMNLVLSILVSHFEALEQTCRLRQLSGSGGKYFFVKLKATVE